MDFQEYLKKSANEIETTIQDFLKDWSKDVDNLSPRLLPLTSLLIEYCKGGKRLRGALVKMGYEMYGGSGEEINKVAAAYEIFQTAILAHDDIIDLSETRRGKPTLYRALGGDHYGISQAIGLGDIGLFLTVKIIADTDFDSERKNKAISFFSQAIINTGLGEVLDVELPHLNQERKQEDVITIHKLKTAYYTISAPLILGAILAGLPATAGADVNIQNKIEKFGENLGIAFQIQDDILGVFGNAQELGKSVTSDIEEGKNTLLITEALKNANGEQKEILEKYYGKGKVNTETVEQIKNVFVQTGALDYSQKEASNYVKMAKQLIPEITDNKKYQSLLEEMSEFLVNRSK